MSKTKPFDWDLLDKILQFKPSLCDTASIMNVSEDTVSRRIKDKFNATFAEYREKRMAPVRMTLVQKAIDMARSGDRTLLIFSLKNYCGWSDQPAEIEKMKETINRLVIDMGVVKDESALHNV